jgi:hypothetical protein
MQGSQAATRQPAAGQGGKSVVPRRDDVDPPDCRLPHLQQ